MDFDCVAGRGFDITSLGHFYVTSLSLCVVTLQELRVGPPVMQYMILGVNK